MIAYLMKVDVNCMPTSGDNPITDLALLLTLFKARKDKINNNYYNNLTFIRT